MVTVIKTGHSIHRILNYNESKVKSGVAELVSAGNYPVDADRLSFSQKLNRLTRQAALNENVTRNSVHVSINFDPSENISTALMGEIAEQYMDKIGFGEQPYLVYRHFDAGHPHIHIVSIKVREDGSRIDTQNIGRNQSEKARKEIEIAYNLKKADDNPRQHQRSVIPAAIQKMEYGKLETKRAIATILGAVLTTYSYTSLPELNALLNEYNVMADKGAEGSRIFANHGLTYRLLDGHGEPVGVPIKASDFHNKPTLKFLEARFIESENIRRPYKQRLARAIDMIVLQRPDLSLQGLTEALAKDGIRLVPRRNQQGLLYGITYIDHTTKCIFNGSALGKMYSAKGIMERCGKDQIRALTVSFSPVPFRQSSPDLTTLLHRQHVSGKAEPGLLEILFQPENSFMYIPAGLIGKGKRKRKKGKSNRL